MTIRFYRNECSKRWGIESESWQCLNGKTGLWIGVWFGPVFAQFLR